MIVFEARSYESVDSKIKLPIVARQLELCLVGQFREYGTFGRTRSRRRARLSPGIRRCGIRPIICGRRTQCFDLSAELVDCCLGFCLLGLDLGETLLQGFSIIVCKCTQRECQTYDQKGKKPD